MAVACLISAALKQEQATSTPGAQDHTSDRHVPVSSGSWAALAAMAGCARRPPVSSVVSKCCEVEQSGASHSATSVFGKLAIVSSEFASVDSEAPSPSNAIA
jgi:hypothetical protein